MATTKATELGQLGSKLTVHNEDITLDGNVHGQYAGFDSDINASSIGDLSNVDITTSAPSNNQSLIWDNANSKFVPGDSFSQSDFNTAFGNKSTSDLSEGTNEYHTTARARGAISATGSLSYNSTSGVMSFTQGNTDTISEGSSNLYYTDARADARVALIVDAAPGTLNTLNELAAALGDDANFSTTVTNSIATKLPLAGGTISGNLAVSGTVDGRDVASDGSKLDGIETGATADQTKADIDALNINANTLDGRQGYQYVFDGLDNGATDIMVNDADFIVRDTTDSITNFLWRDHSASKLYIGTADAQPITRYDLYTQGGSKYWHTGNDGSGSGLDADLLDGQHGSYYYSPANLPAAAPTESFVTYSSAPSIGSAGDVYYNTTEDKAYISNGTVWAPFTNSPPNPTIGTRSLSVTNASAFSHNLDTDFTDDQPITNATYTHNVGSLPPGISISGNLLSGTPTSPGTYTFGISARDALGAAGSDKAYSFVVNPRPFSATGGTEFTSGGYRYHKFTSSGTLTVTGDAGKSTEVLMVAGGGAGGRDDYSGGRGAGGGGAGGLIAPQTISNLQSSLTIVVGAGGGGSGSSGGAGGNGGNTTVTGLSTAIGGGGGGGHNSYTNLDNATSGGSGGGGTNSASGKSGTSGQGNSGARGANGPPYGGGGGGGKNGSGAIGRNEGSAAGGSGTNSYSTWASATSSGDSSYFAGGGAGGGGGVSGSTGGNGGGGNSNNGTGQSNTGGGGAGSRYTAGGSGGSGIVIIRYLV